MEHFTIKHRNDTEIVYYGAELAESYEQWRKDQRFDDIFKLNSSTIVKNVKLKLSIPLSDLHEARRDFAKNFRCNFCLKSTVLRATSWQRLTTKPNARTLSRRGQKWNATLKLKFRH